MDPLPLNPGDYSGTYKLVAGQSSLDFVNTVSWPGREREHDWLDRPENVTLWAQAVGIIDEDVRKALDSRKRRDVPKELAVVRRVRHDLVQVLEPLGRGAEPPSSAVDILNAQVRRACARRTIDPVTRQWTWAAPDSIPAVLWPVIWNAGHVLTEVDRTRIGHCPACDWLFVDTTRNRSRRWCDMADCGSRDKALRYYHRTKPSNRG